MSLLLDSALDAERRRQAEAADAAEAATLATAAKAVSARQRAEALAAYNAVAALPVATEADARRFLVGECRALRHTSMAVAFLDGMQAGVELVLRRLAKAGK